MKRSELMQRVIGLEAVAAAGRAALKAEAEAEYDGNGTVPSWKSAGVSVTGSQRHDRCEVVDQDALMAYLVEHYPQMVHTVVVPRDPKVVAALLAEVAESGPAPDPETGVRPVLKPDDMAPNAAGIPGVVFVAGGAFHTITMTVDSTTRRVLKAAALRYLTGEEDAFDLEQLFRPQYSKG